MPERPLNVLFLYNHNSARSILAEAILNPIGKGRFKAFSASSPRENQQPHPLGLQVLEHAGISTEGLRSKSWDEFGQPATAHGGYADPSAGEGSEAEKLEAFRQTLLALYRRLSLLVSLPSEKLERSLLQNTARKLPRQA